MAHDLRPAEQHPQLGQPPAVPAGEQCPGGPDWELLVVICGSLSSGYHVVDTEEKHLNSLGFGGLGFLASVYSRAIAQSVLCTDGCPHSAMLGEAVKESRTARDLVSCTCPSMGRAQWSFSFRTS